MDAERDRVRSGQRGEGAWLPPGRPATWSSTSGTSSRRPTRRSYARIGRGTDPPEGEEPRRRAGRAEAPRQFVPRDGPQGDPGPARDRGGGDLRGDEPHVRGRRDPSGQRPWVQVRRRARRLRHARPGVRGAVVPAAQVHAAFMAALRFGYAKLVSTDEFLSGKI